MDHSHPVARQFAKWRIREELPKILGNNKERSITQVVRPPQESLESCTISCFFIPPINGGKTRFWAALNNFGLVDWVNNRIYETKRRLLIKAVFGSGAILVYCNGVPQIYRNLRLVHHKLKRLMVVYRK